MKEKMGEWAGIVRTELHSATLYDGVPASKGEK